MTLYELTKKYGEGKGESSMWKTVAAVSDAVEDFMPEDRLHVLKKKIYSMLAGGHYDRDFAEETVADIYYVDRAGNVHRAPYWTMDTVMSVYEQVKSRIPNYNCWDFYVALNTVAADNWCMLNKWFPEMGEDERNDKLVEMTINWLDDPDNPYGSEKAWRYYNQ